jgi:hypothetical protein
MLPAKKSPMSLIEHRAEVRAPFFEKRAPLAGESTKEHTRRDGRRRRRQNTLIFNV